MTGAGTAQVPASHLQPPTPAPQSSESVHSWGFLPAAAARAKRRRVSWNIGHQAPGQREGLAGDSRAVPRGRLLAPGLGYCHLNLVGPWSRVPALCQPRAAGTRTHPRRYRLAGASLPHRGEGVGVRWGGPQRASARSGACRGPGLRPAGWVGSVGASSCEPGIDGVTWVTQRWGGRSPGMCEVSMTDRARSVEGQFLPEEALSEWAFVVKWASRRGMGGSGMKQVV